MISVEANRKINSLKNEALRIRAELGKGGRVKEFIGYFCGEEAGILIYEDWRDDGLAFVYEIYVLEIYRKKGLGAALLLKAEEYAIELQCNRIQLEPYSLDLSYEPSCLKSWYRKLGYLSCVDSPERLQKQLTSMPGTFV